LHRKTHNPFLLQARVLRRFRSVFLAAALAAAGPSAGATPAASTPGLRSASSVDLSLSFLRNGTTAPEAATIMPQSCVTLPLQGAQLFDDKPQEHGWKALAHLLEAITPSVNTDIPLTASQITTRISAMLDQGQNQKALDIIERRLAQEQASYRTGTDVQLMFLHARALAALGRDNEAEKLYQYMTTQYPELPEPWNNLAAEYVKQGKLEMARDALRMALTADPNYAQAHANLGRVQLLLASQSFHDAAKLGIKGAQQKAVQARDALQP
jgi:tetratricopeptide (TPR) repeat protein